MIISNNGIDLIKQFEGLRLQAYLCPAGVWTVGYGTTRGVKRGMTITQEQAEIMLRADVSRFEKAVNDLQRDWTQNQFDALVSFAYNTGVGNLITLCRKRTTHEIAQAMLKYTKANGRTLNGLIRRREAEHKLFTQERQS